MMTILHLEFSVSSIGARPVTKAEVGVATEDGRSYFRITSLLNKIQVPYVDVILKEPNSTLDVSLPATPDQIARSLKLIITTRRERLLLAGTNVLCVEDLGDDIGIAKERFFSALYPFKENDWLVVGIDPGERTGLAVFMSDLEVESSVLVSLDDTVDRVSKLIDNAPQLRKVVKIGSGMPVLAEKIARRLDSQYRQRLKIQLVDERGTSSLNACAKNRTGTRDQRAAKLIAFREGQDYAST